jgi:hypothetical protein
MPHALTKSIGWHKCFAYLFFTVAIASLAFIALSIVNIANEIPFFIKPIRNLLGNTLQKAYVAYTTDLTKAEFRVIELFYQKHIFQEDLLGGVSTRYSEIFYQPVNGYRKKGNYPP